MSAPVPSVPQNSPLRPIPAWIVVAGLAVVALAVRLLNWPVVFGQGRVTFLESDAFYHMRRVVWAVHHGLRMPDFDLYMNFPAGFHPNWPPLFDQLIAFSALLLGLGHPSTALVEWVGALIPPLLGVLTVVLVYFAARLYFSPLYAAITSGVFLLLPYHIQVSVAGRPDHHVAIVLLSVVLFLCVIHLGRQSAPPRLLLFSAVAGLALSLMLGTWTGSLLFVVILYAHFQLLVLATRHDAEYARRVALQGAGLFAFAALFVWPVAARSYWGVTGSWSWDGLSLFHPFLLACGAAGLWGSFLLTQYRLPRRAAGVTVAVAAAILVVLAFFRDGGFPLLAGIPHWLLRQDPMLRHVQESLPLSGANAQENFTRLVFLFPLVGALWGWRLWKQGSFHEALLLCLWAAATGGCTLLQERFSDVFSFPAALFIVEAIALGLAGARRLEAHLDATLEEIPRHRLRYAGWTAGAALLIFIAWPTGRWLVFYARSAPFHSPHALYETCLWLRDHTETTKGYDDSSVRPTYSVLATWEVGNAVAYIAQRPTVANNFVGWPGNREANLKPYRFLVADSLADAEAILDDCGVRYVVVTEPVVSGQFARMLDVLGMDQDAYFGMNAEGKLEIRRKMANTMAMRLYINDGQYMKHFRLVFESSAKRPVAGQLRSVYKVFEYDKWGLLSPAANDF